MGNMEIYLVRRFRLYFGFSSNLPLLHLQAFRVPLYVRAPDELMLLVHLALTAYTLYVNLLGVTKKTRPN
jgi:hypothetical protein